MNIQYAWLIWSFALLIVWTIVYFSLRNKESRREMLVVSLWTSLLGLTEPIFVPKYWSPPSLFDLAIKTGFDIESLLFAFGVGGLAAVIYERIFRTYHVKIRIEEKHQPRHKYHIFVLLSAPIIFVLLLLFTNLNPVYAVFIAFISGGFFTWYCRPDLKKKMLVSAFIFTFIYFIYLLTLVIVYPDYIRTVWNLAALSGVLVVGIPLEELMFAFSLGFLWSSLYEHIKWRKVVGDTRNT